MSTTCIIFRRLSTGAQMTLLHLLFFLSIAVFVLGPLLLFIQREQRRWRLVLDGFILVTVGGISLLHLIPEALVHGGVGVAPFVIAAPIINIIVYYNNY